MIKIIFNISDNKLKKNFNFHNQKFKNKDMFI